MQVVKLAKIKTEKGRTGWLCGSDFTAAAAVAGLSRSHENRAKIRNRF